VATEIASNGASAAHGIRAEYINPFIESVRELFSTMLSCQAQRGNVTLSDGQSATHGIVAIIGLSGPARGTVALDFPSQTAFAIVGRLFGEAPTEFDADVSDTVAEMANIVGGGAKARLRNDSHPIDLGLPTVVVGGDYQVHHPSQSTWLEIPFASELGDFTLRVTFGSDQD
jgi:chemotaxis protein CheX